MIEIYLAGVRLRIGFSFLFIAALTTFYSYDIAVKSFCACLLHEMGHIAVMRFYGLGAGTVTLYGAGIKITPCRGRLIPVTGEALILCGGCAVNFILFLIFGRSEFGTVNLFLCVFNMLPAGGLDGGRLLRLLLGEFLPEAAVIGVCRVTGCIAAVILPAAAFLTGMGNITVVTAAAFMLITALVYN